ncbi:hypothetical protein HD806DRAFT_517338 [Xylariaceae sp. AK1471]|nr:hypothetical protein HD806DRAFT_517338 [Xylariaceae sp. AK1471]
MASAMPRMRFPKVKLGFLKKLLHKRPDPDAIISEPAPDVKSCKQKGEKAAHQEPPLEECPICHDPVGIETPEGIVESWVHLHCKHKFGTHCIQTWLQESAERDPHSIPSCPICRTTAKHPCGHPVLMPALRASPFTIWATPMPPMSPPAFPPPHLQSRRSRRRLTRRSGHPLRPMPPRVNRPRVQTVGECSTCAASAALEKTMRQMTTPSGETGGTTSGGRGRSGDRRAGIKSMLLPPSFRRPSNSTLEPSHDVTFTALFEVSDERPTPIVRMPMAHREYINLCRVHPEGSIPRVPTPTPVLNRRLSF